jgi:hypothetical protein
MKTRIILSLLLVFLSGITHASVNVCLDHNGKKTFSDVACEKRGMKSSTADFPVAQTQAMEPVYVVTSPDAHEADAKPTVKAEVSNKPAKHISTWGADVPLKGLPLFLIGSMPVIASFFFGYQLFLYIRARYRGLAGDRL